MNLSQQLQGKIYTKCLKIIFQHNQNKIFWLYSFVTWPNIAFWLDDRIGWSWQHRQRKHWRLSDFVVPKNGFLSQFSLKMCGRHQTWKHVLGTPLCFLSHRGGFVDLDVVKHNLSLPGYLCAHLFCWSPGKSEWLHWCCGDKGVGPGDQLLNSSFRDSFEAI